MREWTELYRDMLSAYNALAEAIATAKTLHERDTRRMAELAAERDDPDAAQAALETLRGELD